jgi:hypothetical protein
MRGKPGIAIAERGTAVTKKESAPLRRFGRRNGKRKETPYANFFQIGHNAFEFLLEFGQQEASIHTRIYVSPQHARMLADLLIESFREYETAFGPMRSFHEKVEG